jgi:hypothetical protein
VLASAPCPPPWSQPPTAPTDSSLPYGFTVSGVQGIASLRTDSGDGDVVRLGECVGIEPLHARAHGDSVLCLKVCGAAFGHEVLGQRDLSPCVSTQVGPEAEQAHVFEVVHPQRERARGAAAALVVVLRENISHLLALVASPYIPRCS